MKVKTLNPRWDTRQSYFFELQQFEEFEGEELPPPKWVDATANLVLSTGQEDFPMRIIPRNWIVEINGTTIAVPKPHAAIRQVQITGSKGSSYVVTLGLVKTCTCSGFQFRRTCKHISIAEQQ